MSVFYQASAGVLLASILGMVISRQDKSMALLLSLGVCCMVLMLSARFLDPVIVFFEQLQAVGNVNHDLIRILLKITGITLISEVSGMVCADAGNASLGKALQFLASAVILWLSIPVFQSLLELVQEILGGI